MEIMASSRRWDSTLKALSVEVPPCIWWCYRESGSIQEWGRKVSDVRRIIQPISASRFPSCRSYRRGQLRLEKG
jgi:hypothetical protein